MRDRRGRKGEGTCVCVCLCVCGGNMFNMQNILVQRLWGVGMSGMCSCVRIWMQYTCRTYWPEVSPSVPFCLFLFECIIATTSVLCAVWVGCYGTQRRSLWVQYPTTFMWILWLELGSSSLHSECLYLLSHLADPPPYFLREGLPLNLEHKECPG